MIYFFIALFGLATLFIMNTETGKNIVSSIGETAQSVSDYALSLVARLEGFSATAYKDVAGFLTIGYGHKIQSGETVPSHITNEEALKLLDADMQTAASVVDQYVSVPLSEGQRAALISFVYNTSSTDPLRFANSRLLAKVNIGDFGGAADEFDKWVYAGGSVSNGLIARRAQEKEVFLS
jgi:lysozyme